MNQSKLKDGANLMWAFMLISNITQPPVALSVAMTQNTRYLDPDSRIELMHETDSDEMSDYY